MNTSSIIYMPSFPNTVTVPVSLSLWLSFLLILDGYLWDAVSVSPSPSYLWLGKGCRKLRMTLARRDRTQLRKDCRKLGPSCIWEEAGGNSNTRRQM